MKQRLLERVPKRVALTGCGLTGVTTRSSPRGKNRAMPKEHLLHVVSVGYQSTALS